MDDSDFWQHLANDFRLIPDYDRMLRAEGRGIVGSSQPWKWELKGSDAYPWIYGAFKDRVSHGARELPQSGTHDLLIVWLEALRLGGYNFRSTGQASGTIDRVGEASATFCEDRPLQMESQEKQVPESMSSPDTIAESEPVAQSASVGQDEERERRRKLLVEYKTTKAAGGERNGSIEECRNQIPHPEATDLSPDNLEIFSASEDYRSIRYKGVPYTLTRNQSTMIRLLHEAYCKGTPALGKHVLLSAIEAETSRVRDSFKGSLLWGSLIIANRSPRGTYQLNLK